MAAVAVVETREGAELGLREGEADLPGAACREQEGGDKRRPGLPQKPVPIAVRTGGETFGRGGMEQESFWKGWRSAKALVGHLVRGPQSLPRGFKTTMVQQELLPFFLHKKGVWAIPEPTFIH